MTALQTREPLESPRSDVVAHRFAALGEATRVKLVNELRLRGSGTVQELAAAVGASVPNASKHLRVLHEAGIVARRKEGTFVHYSLANQAVAALVQYSLRIFSGQRAPRRPER